MKRLIYWLLGDRAGRVVMGTWRWLWGLPEESGGPVAVAVAQESLQSMQESVQKLADQQRCGWCRTRALPGYALSPGGNRAIEKAVDGP